MVVEAIEDCASKNCETAKSLIVNAIFNDGIIYDDEYLASIRLCASVTDRTGASIEELSGRARRRTCVLGGFCINNGQTKLG